MFALLGCCAVQSGGKTRLEAATSPDSSPTWSCSPCTPSRSSDRPLSPSSRPLSPTGARDSTTPVSPSRLSARQGSCKDPSADHSAVLGADFRIRAAGKAYANLNTRLYAAATYHQAIPVQNEPLSPMLQRALDEKNEQELAERNARACEPLWEEAGSFSPTAGAISESKWSPGQSADKETVATFTKRNELKARPAAGHIAARARAVNFQQQT